MSCVPRERLYAYAEGDLPSDERQTVSEHLSICPLCRDELLLLQRIDEVLAQESLLEPPPAFTRNVMARCPVRPKTVAFRWYQLAWAALVAVGMGFSLWTDWGTELGRASEHLWTWMDHRVEKGTEALEDWGAALGNASKHVWTGIEHGVRAAAISTGTRLDGVMAYVRAWTEAWRQWINHGLEDVGHIGEAAWFLPLGLILLAGLVLYEFLDGLYERRLKVANR